MYSYPLKKCDTIEEVFEKLPNYVKSQKGIPPSWKQRYMNNREFLKKKTKNILNQLL